MCNRCSLFVIKAALFHWNIDECTLSDQNRAQRYDSSLKIGAFNCPINEEKCDLCRTARQVVGCQDKDEAHQIRIIPYAVGTLLVSCTSHDRRYAYGYIHASAGAKNNDSGYEFEFGKTIAAVQQVKSAFGTNSRSPPPVAWYNTYKEELAVAQTLKWLKTCKSHDRCIRKDCTNLHLSNTVFIDVSNYNIVNEDSWYAEEYFALSYVCSGCETLELTTENQHELAVPGSLLMKDLPQTYMDAMRFTKLCGVRYLWIDSICVFHDDERTMDRQIDALDDVYSKAAPVLIAATGTSPGFGLYPKSVEPKKIQDIWLHIQRDSNNLGRAQAHIDDMAIHKYWTRSWCFQEQFLSARKLYFGTHWLQFHCDCVNVTLSPTEDGNFSVQDISQMGMANLYEETRAMRTISRVAESTASLGFHELYRAYATIIGSYTGRQLSYPVDILRAFAGIASVLSRINENRLYAGIPSILLPHALLWSPRKKVRTVKRSASRDFPTYS